MSQIDTEQVRRPVGGSALPSLMLGLGFILNLAWVGVLAWGVYALAGWALS